MKLGRISKLTQGTIGFGGVENQFALKTNNLFHQFGQTFDADLFAGADVDVGVADFMIFLVIANDRRACDNLLLMRLLRRSSFEMTVYNELFRSLSAKNFSKRYVLFL